MQIGYYFWSILQNVGLKARASAHAADASRSMPSRDPERCSGLSAQAQPDTMTEELQEILEEEPLDNSANSGCQFRLGQGESHCSLRG